MRSRETTVWFKLLTCSVLLCFACRDSAPNTPVTLDYQVAATQDSIQIYGCNLTAAECMSCGLYCRYYVTQSASFNATLTLDTAKGTASFMTGTGTVVVNAGVATIAIDVPPYCEHYFLKGSITAASITGTWSEQLDCHGRTRNGSFVGSR